MNTAGSCSSLICLCFESACKPTLYAYDLFGAIDQSSYKRSAKNKTGLTMSRKTEIFAKRNFQKCYLYNIH